MKVLLVAPETSLHTQRWLSGLAEAGCEVRLVTLASGAAVAGAAGRGAVQRVATRDLVRRPLAVRARLCRIVADYDPALAHVQSVGSHGLLGLLLPAELPLVVTPWGSEVVAAESSLARRLVARRVLRRAGRVVTTSRAMKEHVQRLAALPAERVDVVSWGVPDDLLCSALTPAGPSAPAAPTREVRVLSVRTTSAIYRTLELARAFARVAPERPELHLTLVDGHVPSNPRARRHQEAYRGQVRAALADVPAQVSFRSGRLEPVELLALMRTHDVAVSAPIADQRSSSVLEALAAGTRLLGADLPAYREMRADGLELTIVPEPLEQGLVRALRTVTPLPAAEQARNRDFVDRHERWSRQAGRITAAYAELVEGGARP